MNMAFIPLREFKGILDTMQGYLSRLTFLASLRWPANNLRVTITDAAVPIVGTINQTAIWWYSANMQVMATTNINANISNISNFTIS